MAFYLLATQMWPRDQQHCLEAAQDACSLWPQPVIWFSGFLSAGSLLGTSPVLPLVSSHWIKAEGDTHTVTRPRHLLLFRGDMQMHGNVPKHLIAVSIAHKQLLVLVDLAAALIKYLPLMLHCSQVPHFGESCTADIRQFSSQKCFHRQNGS